MNFWVKVVFFGIIVSEGSSDGFGNYNEGSIGREGMGEG